MKTYLVKIRKTNGNSALFLAIDFSKSVVNGRDCIIFTTVSEDLETYYCDEIDEVTISF